MKYSEYTAEELRAEGYDEITIWLSRPVTFWQGTWIFSATVVVSATLIALLPLI